MRVRSGNTYNLDELGFQLMMIKILVALIKEGIGIKLRVGNALTSLSISVFCKRYTLAKIFVVKNKMIKF